ncbi:MAG: phenylacetate-CoA oxygenase subunit PaaJ [Acidobacteriota bacterium]|nr:MAG: phenylacetate-CoA oxygenase subunit PaaJ [Acidobacteriota bacterium]
MTPTREQILEIVSQVMDPEVPVISVVDLGIVRDVRISEGDVEIDITPTYSGCPAMQTIEGEIIEALKQHGFESVTIKTVFSPPWTTEWMSQEARRKLKAYGIAPPGKRIDNEPFGPRADLSSIACPFCESADTRLTSEFGSTACKSLHFCNGCQQPFEHFKCH